MGLRKRWLPPSRIATHSGHVHAQAQRRGRGVAKHPSRIGEISVSARNPPLLFSRVPPAGFCPSSSSSSSSCWRCSASSLHPTKSPSGVSCTLYCCIVGCNLAKRFTGTQKSLVRVNLSTHITHIPHNTAEACTHIATRASTA